MPGAHDDRRDAKGPGPRRRKSGHAQAALRRTRHRALRRPVRAPHAGHEVLRDAGPDGGHRPSGGHLAGRRAAGHEHVPGRGLHRADDPGGRRRRGARPPVRPDGGPRRGQGPDRRGDGRRGDGGRVRRPARHDRRPAGDRARLQDADRPRRRDHRRGADLPGRGPGVRLLPGRRRPDRDGRGRHADRRPGGRAGAARRLRPRAEVHLHRAVVPEPGRRDDVAGAAAAAGGDRAPARAARARGQPVRDAALRGLPLADALLARRRRVRDLPRDVLEDPLPGAAAGLDGRAAAGAGQAQPGEGRGGPLLLAVVAAVRADLLRRARLARLRAVADGALPAAAGHHARGAGRALPARGDLDAAAGRALHLGAAARLHRHHGPARAGAPRPRGVRARPRGLPGRPRRLGDAAELLRRRRRRHPRGDPPDRQGRARAGRAVRHAHRRRARVAARSGADSSGTAGRRRGRRRRAGRPRIVPLRRRAG